MGINKVNNESKFFSYLTLIDCGQNVKIIIRFTFQLF